MPDLRWIADAPHKPKVPFLTRANVGEVLPEPPSPASWDLVFANGGTIRGWHDCATKRLGVDPAELDPDPNKVEWIVLAGGYGYLNASWIRIWGERTPGMSADAIDQAYFGDHPDVPKYVAEPWHQNPATTAAMEQWLAWVLGDMGQSELETQRLEAREIRAAWPDLNAMSDSALLDRAIGFRAVCRRMFDVHINQSGAAAIGPGVIGAVCAAIGRPEAAMRLLAGFGNVDSAAPSYAMWELSRTVRNSPALTELFGEGMTGLTERIRGSGAPGVQAFSNDLDAFLAEFGSRGPNEWDLISQTWETNPDLALAAIDRMRLAPDSGSPIASNAAREAERKELTAEILAALDRNEDAAAQFKAGCASASVFVPGRERSKTSIIRVIQETRMSVWEIGRRAVARGEIAKPSDICFLFEDELRSHAEGGLQGITAIVDERKRHYDWLYSLEPPFIINGPPPPNTNWAKRADAVHARAEAGAVLQGVPGCPGTARGRARVVLTPADPTVLEPGDILVAPMTDPAWTPLFVPAAGVVVDVGAALSHAIIVSRELGIPCAVSVTGASKRIPDGALIEVNGDSGSVTVLELP